MAVEVFHINPATGRPNLCHDGDTCEMGGDDFHYASKHDAEVAWKARQLERGIIAYRSVMQKQEKEEVDRTTAALRKAQGGAKKMSFSILRSLAVKNLSRYVVNFTGLVVSYAVVSGQWIKEDWARRLIPIVATVALVGFTAWFAVKIYRGSRKTARVVKKRRETRRSASPRSRP